jgi:hypothetical protein
MKYRQYVSFFILGDNPHEHKDTRTELSIESNEIGQTESLFW